MMLAAMEERYPPAQCTATRRSRAWLRRPAGKERLVVIDFVGNHRIFLDRLRLLLTLGPSPVTLRPVRYGPERTCSLVSSTTAQPETQALYISEMLPS